MNLGSKVVIKMRKGWWLALYGWLWKQVDQMEELRRGDYKYSVEDLLLYDLAMKLGAPAKYQTWVRRRTDKEYQLQLTRGEAMLLVRRLWGVNKMEESDLYSAGSATFRTLMDGSGLGVDRLRLDVK